ncbi:MAG: M23 family metallopeptidase [Acidimicrobiia bacterium]|nr:M23 family metallopeptidase [Acidimicrobiia bacterium]
MPLLKLSALLLLAVTLLVPSIPAAAEEDFVFVYFPHEDIESRFSDDWGDPRSGGRRHQGNDIFGAKHSQVIAVADGFVTAIGTSRRSGNYVRLVHRDGWETWYMHLNNDSPGSDDGSGGPEWAFAPGPEEGMFVAAGTVIGYVGDSGNAERGTAHTHFELHDGRRVVNPYSYLSDAHERWLRVLELSDQIR